MWKVIARGRALVYWNYRKRTIHLFLFHAPPPSVGGLDRDSRSSGCARLGGEVGPPLGVVVEEVAVLVVLVRRHRHAVRAAARRAVDDEIPGAIKEEFLVPQVLSFFPLP